MNRTLGPPPQKASVTRTQGTDATRACYFDGPGTTVWVLTGGRRLGWGQTRQGVALRGLQLSGVCVRAETSVPWTARAPEALACALLIGTPLPSQIHNHGSTPFLPNRGVRQTGQMEARSRSPST
jgi:hypothetical protein